MLKHRTLLLLSLTALLALTLTSCRQEPNCSLQKHTPSCMKALAKQAQHELDLERKAIQIEQDLQAREAFLYHMARLSPLLILLVCLGTIIGFASLYKGFEHRYTSSQAINHMMKLQEQQLQADTVVALAEAEAKKPLPVPPNAPKHLHYAPHIRISGTPRSSTNTAADTTTQTPEIDTTTPHTETPPSIPSALDVLNYQHFVLGYSTTGQAIEQPLSSLKSFGIGGVSGSGKTSLLAFLLAQSILKEQAQLILIDPHLGSAESLANKLASLNHAFIAPPSDLSNAHTAIQTALDQFQQRQHHHQPYTPLFICFDEWLALMRHKQLKAPAQELAEKLTQEGRKYNMHGVFASQKWTASKSGDMRDTLPSHIVCRTRQDLGRHQTGRTADDLPKDLMALQTGEFYLLSDADPLKLALPYLDPQELSNITTRNRNTATRTALPDETGTAVPVPQLAPETGTKQERNSKGNRGETTLDPEALDIIERFRKGESIPEIARAISGKRSGTGYLKASARVQEALRIVL